MEKPSSEALPPHEAAENFSVLAPLEFLEDFTKEAHHAKKRVWAQVMFMEQGHAPGLIAHTLEQTAKKGIDTELHVDSFSLMVPSKKIDIQRILNEKMFARLKEAGVRITFTNPPKGIEKAVPFMGRRHVKMFIVDDTAWIGGLNLGEDNLQSNIDFEVKITKPEIVETLASEFERMKKALPDNDYEVPCDEQTTILVDVGRKGQSLILDRAVEMVRSAKHSVQNLRYFVPAGKFLDALQEARKRGVKVSVVAADPNRITDKPFRIVDEALEVAMRIKGGLPISYYPGWLHAKLLIVDGKTVLFGSHNLSLVDVLAGTSEMNLLSRNPTLVENLEAFFNTIQLKASKDRSK